jgi:hypothetical protein
MEVGDTLNESLITDDELEWCWRNVPESFSLKRFQTDLSRMHTADVDGYLSTTPASLLPLLHIPGVLSRLDEFALCVKENETAHSDPKAMLRSFADRLGRVTSYRALALTETQYRGILDAKCKIFKLMTTHELLFTFLVRYFPKRTAKRNR